MHLRRDRREGGTSYKYQFKAFLKQLASLFSLYHTKKYILSFFLKLTKSNLLYLVSPQL